VAAPAAERTRQEVTTLSDDQLATLKKAFQGMMARDPDQPDSYYVIAGVHGLPGGPGQSHCLHHEDRFNPWHRVYLKVFEDALRSVEGCEDVTMPYWDFTTPLPGVFSEPPFDQYALPANPGLPTTPQPDGSPTYPYTTQRNDAAAITRQMQSRGVFDDVKWSLQTHQWGAYRVSGYQKFSIQAHDGAHLSTGPTMADQDVASYDPVFWFYHCNIDRLWLSWQTNAGATDLQGFMSTLPPPPPPPAPQTPYWLTRDPFDTLPPYSAPPVSMKAQQTIAYGIAYDRLEPVPSDANVLQSQVGSLDARRRFSIKSSAPVSVRVKDIARLNIPGSFDVNLLADGEVIAKRAFFQPRIPTECPTCAGIPLVNIDFLLDQEQLVDKTLSVEIEVLGHDEMGKTFPLAQAGDPTINARLLLQDE
jgi:hypothetical protein